MEQDNTIFRELAHKVKSVNDLVRFLRNRTENTPVFSFFLGSGCSISSGVKSGEALVRRWKEEIYNESRSDDVVDSSIDEFLDKQNWYDSRNAYASLFEKRYDLQTQRRAFLEQLIKDAKPSIGYAYLTKLVEANFVNTIFTTNFDDLINEAFYLYSTKRPLVCAHDSAISSIAVTSSRPKIIKLHGDYLFENLKNTLRETESLEDNMKEKFMEFAKDFGLIVVGYSGCDRSIMDILSVMIKNGDYFKNGIYWCLLKGTKQVPSELKKLLWSDRVYLVEIEGFDELMAVLNHDLNNGQLPINDTVLSKKHQLNLIDSLIAKQSSIISSSEIIKNDIARLKKELDKNTVSDFLELAYNVKDTKNRPKVRSERKGPLDKLSDDERTQIRKIQVLLEKDEFEKVMNLISSSLSGSISDNLRTAYLYLKLVALQRMDVCDDSKYLPILDELISLNPTYEDFYLDASNRSQTFEEKVRYIDAAINVFPYDYSLYNYKAKILRDYSENLVLRDDAREQEIIMAYTRSMELEKGIDNDAWSDLSDFYFHYYKNEIDKRNQVIEEILSTYAEIDKNHPKVLELSDRLFGIGSNEETITKLKEAYEWAKKADRSARTEKCLILYINKLFSEGNLDEALNILHDYENNFQPSISFQYQKVNWLLNEQEADIDAAIALLEALITEFRSAHLRLIRLYVIKGETEKLESLHSRFQDEETHLLYLHETDKHGDYCDFIDEHYLNSDKPISLNILMCYTYSAIMSERYDKGYHLAFKYIKNPSVSSGELWINYLILKSKYDKKAIDKSKIKEKIFDSTIQYGDDVLAAAYALSGDKDKAIDHIVKFLKHNNISKYIMRQWPAFESIKNEERFKRAVGLG